MAYPDLQDRDPAQRAAICHSLWRDKAISDRECERDIADLIAFDNWVATLALGIPPDPAQSSTAGNHAVTLAPKINVDLAPKITVEIPQDLQEWLAAEAVERRRTEERHKEQRADMAKVYQVIANQPVIVPPAEVKITVPSAAVQVNLPEPKKRSKKIVRNAEGLIERIEEEEGG